MSLTENLVLNVRPAVGDTFIKNLVTVENVAASGTGTITLIDDAGTPGWKVVGARQGTFSGGVTYEGNTFTLAVRYKANTRGADYLQHLALTNNATLTSSFGAQLTNAGTATGPLRVREVISASGFTVVGMPAYTTGQFFTAVLRFSDGGAAGGTLDVFLKQTSRANNNPDYTLATTAMARGGVLANLFLGFAGTDLTFYEMGAWMRGVTNAEAATVADDIRTALAPVVATAPGAPTIGTATAGNGSASVAGAAPASNGGAAITLYRATSTPGGIVGTSATLPVPVAGLTNGTAYTFALNCDNSAGTSPMSAASNSVTPAADTAAPTLSSPTAEPTGPTTASGTVVTNEDNGTLYSMVSSLAFETKEAIKTSGAAQVINSAGTKTVTASGLTPSTYCYLHYVHADAAGNDSAVVRSDVFLTSAAANTAPTSPGTVANISGTGGAAITPVNVSAAFSDTDTLTYSASPAGTAWPSGLVIAASTGIISGTVATGTTAGLKVRATDTASQSVDSNAFSAILAAPASTVTGVTVSPGTATVAGGSTQAFAATVAGANTPSQTVNWTTSVGSVNSSGVLTAPAATGSAQTVTVTATSAQDGTKAGTATVTVPAATAVTFPATLPMKAVVAGALRTTVACRAAVYNKTTDALVGIKTGLATNADGTLPAFSIAGAVAGTQYRINLVADADATMIAAFMATPA